MKRQTVKFKNAYLLKNLPLTTHLPFKGACAMRGLSMRSVLIQLMRRYTKAVRNDERSIRVDDFRKPKMTQENYERISGTKV
jgi:hypothetical protein